MNFDRIGVIIIEFADGFFFPVPAPILVMVVIAVGAAWVDLRSSGTRSAVSFILPVFALGTVLVPLGFIRHSLTGTGWIDTSHWYWIWIMVFGAGSAALFIRQLASGRISRA